MTKINGCFVLLMACVIAHAMDRPHKITPEYFIAQTEGDITKGKELLSQCLPNELRALWQYIVAHEKDITMSETWIRAMLDLHTKKGNGHWLRSYLNSVCADKVLPLNAAAVNHIVGYLSAECIVKKSRGCYVWQPLVPLDTALECLELLIAKRVEMNGDTIWGLMQSDKVALIELLLRKGAVDANSIAVSRRFPIWHLARSAEMFNLLMQYGNTQIDSVDENGLTVLHRYARDSDIFGSVPELLFRIGANINVQDPQGDTPLHLAVTRNKHAAQAWLVSKGADCFIKNKAGACAVPVTLSKAYTREIMVPENS
jgi:hypothetical protein